MFFFNDTATTEIYTLSLHDALPSYPRRPRHEGCPLGAGARAERGVEDVGEAGGVAGHGQPRPVGEAVGDGGVEAHQVDGDRKSTRLNSSHANISYAVFCLKKTNTSSLLPTSSTALFFTPSPLLTPSHSPAFHHHLPCLAPLCSTSVYPHIISLVSMHSFPL